MKRRRVLVLMHEDLVPGDDFDELPAERRLEMRTEADVCRTLAGAGHEVVRLGVRDDIGAVRRAVEETRPHVVFNLLEEFHDLPQYDHAVVSYLELIRMAYTGCGPRGLVLARDKALSKQILVHHRVHVPSFMVCRRRRKVKRHARLTFPLIVKTLEEEGSVGISQASLVRNDEKLVERVEYLQSKFGGDVIAEEFIPGREIYASVIGNQVLTVYPLRELIIENRAEGEPLINTEKSKWDKAYQDRKGVFHGPAEVTPEVEAEIGRVAKRIYRTLRLVGYARIDFRLRPDGKLYFIEANPNPEIANEEEFAWSAACAGVEYPELLDKILSLGIGRRRRPAS
jgi:D-alanine-D-alanine ligase